MRRAFVFLSCLVLCALIASCGSERGGPSEPSGIGGSNAAPAPSAEKSLDGSPPVAPRTEGADHRSVPERSRTLEHSKSPRPQTSAAKPAESSRPREEVDERPRSESDYRTDQGRQIQSGTLTAGNASPFTDGAAALTVISPALESQILPDAALIDFEFVAVEPQEGLLMGPGKAMLRILQRHRLRWGDLDYIEMHEAFAGQILCNLEAVNDPAYRQKAYGVSYDPGPLEAARLNPWGSSIAYGHPFGATGARMLNQAIGYLKETGTKRALLGICTAGALAGAALLDRKP